DRQPAVSCSTTAQNPPHRTRHSRSASVPAAGGHSPADLPITRTAESSVAHKTASSRRPSSAAQNRQPKPGRDIAPTWTRRACRFASFLSRHSLLSLLSPPLVPPPLHLLRLLPLRRHRQRERGQRRHEQTPPSSVRLLPALR